MADLARAFLNLLAGGTQGFAEGRRRRTKREEEEVDRDVARRDRRKEVFAEQDIKARGMENERQYRTRALEQDQNQFSAREAREKGEFNTRESREAHEFDVNQARESKEADRKYQLDDRLLDASSTIRQLQERIARLQNDNDDKFDPHRQIARAAAEVYTKIASGDTPELAGELSVKAASDLQRIYQSIGLLPSDTPTGADTGPVSDQVVPGANSIPFQQDDRALLTFPGLTAGRGRFKMFRGSKALADSLLGLHGQKGKDIAERLRSVGNAQGR